MFPGYLNDEKFMKTLTYELESDKAITTLVYSAVSLLLASAVTM